MLRRSARVACLYAPYSSGKIGFPRPVSHRERLRLVQHYIEDHLEERLMLADLAEVASLSPYHFIRSFKQAVGVGPQRYVMRPNEALAEIAQRVGFADQSHLTSIFRREIGTTPGRYRAALA